MKQGKLYSDDNAMEWINFVEKEYNEYRYFRK